MTKQLFRTAFLLVVLGAAFLVSACNTTKGLGTDIKKAGSGLENSAEKHGAD